MLITKKETVTEQRDVVYNKCDKCGTEKEAKGQQGSGWMTCVKMSDRDYSEIVMAEKMFGRSVAVEITATKCTRSLCEKCSLLFEKFVEEASNVINS